MKPVTLITGGQQGIGLGIARELVAEGHRLALVAELGPDAPRVTSALDALGPGARYFQHDLAHTGHVTPLLDRIEQALGPVTGLVSNAGVPARVRQDLLELTAENFDFVLDVNLRGAFFLAQAAARRMLDLPERPCRTIVFITSVSAAMVSVERAEYCISKAGASMMAQLFAARLAGAGISVFELRPGIIETDMTAGVKDSYTQRIEAGLVPAKRWGTPADIGTVIRPLMRGDMAFATGSIIPVDGGLSIHQL